MRKFTAGFTLIEIVLVIALIGVVATLLVSLVDPVRQFKKSNDAKRKADMHQLQAVFELYRADQNQYPDILPPCGSELLVDTTVYMKKIPCDPKNSGQLQYSYVRLTPDTYTLTACLENVSDPQKDEPNAINPSGGTYCDGTTGWSYTLTNP